MKPDDFNRFHITMSPDLLETVQKKKKKKGFEGGKKKEHFFLCGEKFLSL